MLCKINIMYTAMEFMFYTIRNIIITSLGGLLLVSRAIKIILKHRPVGHIIQSNY